MSDNGGGQIRVTLRWIQIKDNKEAMWDDEGEFRFRSKITTSGKSHELEFPEQGYWSISDHPRRNKVDKIDKVLYEGEQGDTLIVETININPLQMGQSSIPISPAGKITERFSRYSDTEMFYQFTVEDDNLYSRPWTAELSYHAMDGQLYEYACHEGNYAMPGILAGARRQEREAAAGER